VVVSCCLLDLTLSVVELDLALMTKRRKETKALQFPEDPEDRGSRQQLLIESVALRSCEQVACGRREISVGG
jgi:hypothetical protein